MTNEAHQLAGEIRDGGKDASGDYLAFDFGEPDLYLVEPGGVGRREVEMDVGRLGQELGDPLALMSGVVVGDDVDLPASRLGGDQFCQEGHELFRGTARGGVTQDSTALDVQRGVERERTVPEVLEPVPLQPARRQGQNRADPAPG